jgi:hypothetical protein
MLSHYMQLASTSFYVYSTGLHNMLQPTIPLECQEYNAPSSMPISLQNLKLGWGTGAISTRLWWVPP